MTRGQNALIGVAFIVAVGVATLLTLRDSGGPLLVYEKQGGFQGVALDLTIERDGTAVLRDEAPEASTARFVLDDETMANLEEAIGRVDWADVAGDHSVAGADLIQVTFTHEGRTVRGNLSTPQEQPLFALVAILDREIAQARS